MAHKVVVRAGVNDTPLLITDKANAVEVYDDDGNMIALLHHIFNERLWCVTTRDDPDWEQTIFQFGYIGAGRQIKDS